jgi:hypothetical protein
MTNLFISTWNKHSFPINIKLDVYLFLDIIYEFLKKHPFNKVDQLYVLEPKNRELKAALSNFRPFNKEDQKAFELFKNIKIISKRDISITLITNIIFDDNYFLAYFYSYEFNKLFNSNIKSKKIFEMIGAEESGNNIFREIDNPDHFLEIVTEMEKLREATFSGKLAEKTNRLLIPSDIYDLYLNSDSNFIREFSKIDFESKFNKHKTLVKNVESRLFLDFSQQGKFMLNQPEMKEVFTNEMFNFIKNRGRLNEIIEDKFASITKAKQTEFENNFKNELNDISLQFLNVIDFNFMRYFPKNLYNILSPQIVQEFEIILKNNSGNVLIIGEDANFIIELIKDSLMDNLTSLIISVNEFPIPIIKHNYYIIKDFDKWANSKQFEIIQSFNTPFFESSTIIIQSSVDLQNLPILQNLKFTHIIHIPEFKSLRENYPLIALFYLNKIIQFEDSSDTLNFVTTITSNYFDFLFDNISSIEQLKSLSKIDKETQLLELLHPFTWYQIGIETKKYIPPTEKQKLPEFNLVELLGPTWHIHYNFNDYYGEGHGFDYLFYLVKLEGKECSALDTYEMVTGKDEGIGRNATKKIKQAIETAIDSLKKQENAFHVKDGLSKKLDGHFTILPIIKKESSTNKFLEFHPGGKSHSKDLNILFRKIENLDLEITLPFRYEIKLKVAFQQF